MIDTAAPTLAPRIEYVREGHYLRPGGVREWSEHSYSDTPFEDFDRFGGVNKTNKIGQPNEWRIVERDLNLLYAVQGHYPTRTGRSWRTHTGRVDLETARLIYRWYHRLCQDPHQDMANKARVVNMGTGEVVEMEGFVLPAKQPGDAMKTIPVTPEEWDATRRTYSDGCPGLRRGLRRDGSFVWKYGRDHIVGYEDVEGNVRIRPRDYQPPREPRVAQTA